MNMCCKLHVSCNFWTNVMPIQAMVDTYKNNPSFADEKTKAKVKGEYETVQEKVGEKVENGSSDHQNPVVNQVSQAEGVLSDLNKQKGEIQAELEPKRPPQPSKRKSIKKPSSPQAQVGGGPPPPPAPQGSGSAPPPPPPPGPGGPAQQMESPKSDPLPPPPFYPQSSADSTYDDFDYGPPETAFETYDTEPGGEVATATYDYDSQGAEDILR